MDLPPRDLATFLHAKGIALRLPGLPLAGSAALMESSSAGHSDPQIWLCNEQ